MEKGRQKWKREEKMEEGKKNKETGKKNWRRGRKKWRRGRKKWRRAKGYKCPLMTPFAIIYFQVFPGDQVSG